MLSHDTPSLEIAQQTENLKKCENYLITSILQARVVQKLFPNLDETAAFTSFISEPANSEIKYNHLYRRAINEIKSEANYAQTGDLLKLVAEIFSRYNPSFLKQKTFKKIPELNADVESTYKGFGAKIELLAEQIALIIKNLDANKPEIN